jgi:hypothetical protein
VVVVVYGESDYGDVVVVVVYGESDYRDVVEGVVWSPYTTTTTTSP